MGPREDKLPSIKKNYIFNTLYQLLSIITPLITAPYTSRVLGADNIGIQSFTSSNTAVFTLIAVLGTASYGQREISMARNDRKKSSRLFWEIELISLISSVFVLALWAIWVYMATQYRIYYAVLTVQILAVAFDISWYFGGFEKFGLIVARNAAIKIVGIIVLFALVRDGDDLLLYMALLSITGLLGNLSMWLSLKGMLDKVSIKDIHPFSHLKNTIAYFIPSAATSVYTILDKSMIGFITGSEAENGYYEQAVKIIRMIQSVVFSLNTVMYARMSLLFSEGKITEMKKKIADSYDFLLTLSIPVMFGLVAVSGNFVLWFFGEGFEMTGYLLCLLAPLPAIVCISNVLGSQYLTPSGQRVRSTKGILAGAAVNVVLNLILIPRYGAAGAALGSVAAELVISLIYIYMSRDVVRVSQLLHMSVKKLAASLIMFGGILLLTGTGLSGAAFTLVQFVAGAVIYIVAMFVLRDSFAMTFLKWIKIKCRKKSLKISD